MTTRTRSLCLLVGVFLILSGCQFARPIRIGFVGELSGRNAVLGVQARNGAQLAVETVNAQGGVRGRPLELVVRDNMGQVEELLKADRELIDSQVVALTGHSTSWESLAALDALAAGDVVLFSPTTSTPALTGKRDNFFRLIPSNQTQARALAEYLAGELGLRRAAVAFESDNAAYAQTLAGEFASQFRSLGGAVLAEQEFSSSSFPDYAQIVRGLRSAGPADVLLIAAPSIDTAMLAQQARMQGWDVQIATTSWAYTDDLLHNGGRAVEGMLITPTFNDGCQQPAYRDFFTRYQKTYDHEPSFSAVFAYETILVLARALEQTGGTAKGLPEAIIASGQFDGLCDKVRMDEYGDVQRSLYLMQVQDGAFQVIRTIDPQP